MRLGHFQPAALYDGVPLDALSIGVPYCGVLVLGVGGCLEPYVNTVVVSIFFCPRLDTFRFAHVSRALCIWYMACNELLQYRMLPLVLSCLELIF